MTDKGLVPLDKAPITWDTLVSLSKTPTVPDRYAGRPMDMFAAVLIGRELDLGPMESINELYLVDGKVSMSAKLMVSLVQRHGHLLKTVLGPKQAEVEAIRLMPDGSYQTVGHVTFTEEDAKQAGLWGKGAWKAWPQVMLGWRAVSIAARFYFPECLTSAKYEASEMDIEVEEMPALPNAVVVASDEIEEVEEALDADAIAEVFDAEVVTDEGEDE